MTTDPLSISNAAKSNPDRVAVKHGGPDGEDLSFAQVAALVKKRVEALEKTELSVPFSLTVKADLDSLLSIYALLELKVPILLFHQSLTVNEKNRFLKQVQEFKEPLPCDTAIVIFTSGSTGKPKATILTRRALYESALSSGRNIPLQYGDVWQLSLSPARIGGFSIITRSLIAGTAISFAPKFSAQSYTQSWDKDEVTIASIVPTMLIKILEECPDWRPGKKFKTFLVGGAPTSRKVREAALKRGFPLVMTYGMTETASNVVTTPFDLRYSITAGSGKANPGAEIKIDEGRVFVRGPMLMSGYWDRPVKNVDGWFDSGDIGYIDENGFIHIRGREKDVILSGGDNVYPNEVETALESIEGIKQALVIGKPDDTWGAIVSALLVPENREKLPQPESIIRCLSETLARYKSPRLIAWVDELPIASSGKLLRHPSVLEGKTFTTLHYTQKNPAS